MSVAEDPTCVKSISPPLNGNSIAWAREGWTVRGDCSANDVNINCERRTALLVQRLRKLQDQILETHIQRHPHHQHLRSGIVCDQFSNQYTSAKYLNARCVALAYPSYVPEGGVQLPVGSANLNRIYRECSVSEDGWLVVNIFDNRP